MKIFVKTGIFLIFLLLFQGFTGFGKFGELLTYLVSFDMIAHAQKHAHAYKVLSFSFLEIPHQIMLDLLHYFWCTLIIQKGDANALGDVQCLLEKDLRY